MNEGLRSMSKVIFERLLGEIAFMFNNVEVKLTDAQKFLGIDLRMIHSDVEALASIDDKQPILFDMGDGVFKVANTGGLEQIYSINAEELKVLNSLAEKLKKGGSNSALDAILRKLSIASSSIGTDSDQEMSTQSETSSILLEMIDKNKVVRFEYHGKTRIVKPIELRIHEERGSVTFGSYLYCFDLEKLENRMYRVDQIEGVEEAEDADYEKNSSANTANTTRFQLTFKAKYQQEGDLIPYLEKRTLDNREDQIVIAVNDLQWFDSWLKTHAYMLEDAERLD
ncbi:MAG: WYL domain-containing protein [Candidatus Ancillula sp.]|jgi:predicted DNA-binding transcriptional regulator YafY|nr:WYL domain-containing protein [Candidatus Ancillula sp.]